MTESLRWEALEHEHIERGRDWFYALGIAAVAIAVTAIIFHDTLFAILIILAAATIGMLANRTPEIVQFELSDRGIRVGRELHRFDDLHAFWVEEERGEPTLLLQTNKPLSPHLVIPLVNVSPDDVRNTLSEKVEEVPMHEPISHKILELLGF